MQVQKKAHRDQERNLGVDGLLIDVDFAENFSWVVRCAIQATYWVTLSCSLFIGISQHLDKEIYDKSEGDLRVDDQCTYNGASGPFWCIVVSPYDDDDDDQVDLRDAQGTLFRADRGDLSHRVLITKAHCIVSDDMSHDTDFFQAAMSKIEGTMSEAAPHVREWFLRSDGAGSHFKNRYSISFMKKFALESGLRGVCWDFGCPGHGKGPWDGLAGTIKRTMRIMIVDEDLILADAGAVYRKIQGRFGTPNWAAHQKKTKGKIRDMAVSWLPTADIERPTSSVAAVKCPLLGLGLRHLFSFKVAWLCGGRTAHIAMRRSSCGCATCMKHGDAADAHATEADGFAPQCPSTNQTSSIGTIAAEDETGIAAERRRNRDIDVDRAGQLKIGGMAAFWAGGRKFVLGQVQATSTGAAFDIATDTAARSDDREACERGDPIVKIRVFDDETDGVFAPGEYFHANGSSLLTAEVSYSTIGRKPPGGYKAPSGFDFTGCTLVFPLREYLDDPDDEETKRNLARLDPNWETATGQATVLSKKSARRWIIGQAPLDPAHEFDRSASYILGRLHEGSPNLPPHPQYPYPIQLPPEEHNRLLGLAATRAGARNY
jgi:hypothetical protein